MQTPSPDVSPSADSISQKFEDIYRQYYSNIAGYVWNLLPSCIKHEAEHLAQDAFISAFQQIDSFANLPERDALRWLFRVAHNKAIDRYRNYKLIEWYSIEQFDALYKCDVLPSGEDFEEQVIARDLIQHCMSSLPKKHQISLTCLAQDCFEQDIPYEVAKCRRYRAKRAFREAYAQEVAS